jgi:hypothetical protein
MIERSTLSDRQRDLATRIFRRLAEAEAKVHGSTIEKVHFHEVGAVDSIADIVGAAIGWDLLGVDQIFASPIPTGTGFIEIAHGRCSIPAPATGELLTGIPLADFPVDGELTTPTGAAIVATLVDQFGPLPAMTIDRIGYGAGQRDFPHANLLRLIVGGPASAGRPSTSTHLQTDSIILLETNLDDAPGELVAHASQSLLDAGALDVSTTAIQMKKGRPGVMLSVQTRPDDADRLEAILFRETTTLGIRRTVVSRHTLPREPHEVQSAWGPIAGKLARLPDGSERFAPEYEACRDIASKHNLPLTEVMAAAQRAFTTNKDR